MMSGGVILVIADMGSGGAQQVASQLADHWVGQGRRVGMLTLAAAATDFFKVSDKVERYSIGGVDNSTSIAERITRNFRRVLAIRRVLRAFKGDTAIAFIAPTNVLLILSSIGLDTRVVICERNDPRRQSFGAAWDALRRILYRYADIVTVNSIAALEPLRAYVPERKLVYLPNPLRLPGAADTSASRLPIILNVGRLHYQKGQDYLIRAFATVADQIPEWQLTIVGEGDERDRLQSLIGQYALSERVKLIGRVADPFAWYRRASIFAFPSRWEGTPNALLEAMSCGLPVVVSRASLSVTELVRDGQEGLVIPADDERAFGEALVRLVKDESLRGRLGLNGEQQARNFLPETSFAAWNQVLWARA